MIGGHETTSTWIVEYANGGWVSFLAIQDKNGTWPIYYDYDQSEGGIERDYNAPIHQTREMAEKEVRFLAETAARHAREVEGIGATVRNEADF